MKKFLWSCTGDLTTVFQRFERFWGHQAAQITAIENRNLHKISTFSLQAPYMPIRERVNVLVIGLLVEGYRAAIESSSLSTPIPPLHSTTSTHFGIFRSIQALRAQALLGHHTSHKLSGLRAAPRAHSTSKSHGGQDQRGGIRHITRSLNGMSGLRLYDCLLLNGTSGDDGYGLRHIEENGDTYEAGTRMQRAYQQAGRQTPVSDDDDQPVRRETQDCIFVAGLTDDAALEDVWDQLESQLDEADQALYRQIANIYLQLFQHSFSKIGSLSVAQDAGAAPHWRVTSGPLTFKMNEVERMGGVQVGSSDGPFDLAVDYFQALADQSLSHLLNNHRASRDEQELLDDHKSICVLRSLAEHFSPNGSIDSEHKLFCDDLRFGNILVDESYRIVAVLDWEFCYVAPRSFLCSPPSWLIGTEPFEWKDTDVSFYKDQLSLFLELLEEEEERCQADHALSRLMRQSMRDGAFWYNLATRESFPLSDIMSHCQDIEAFQTSALSKNLACRQKDCLDKTQAPQRWKQRDFMRLPPFLSTLWQALRPSLPSFINRLADWLNRRGREEDVYASQASGGQ
ncbi:hypothetical protein HRG_008249 [Hirsutella rhossiliensis]|uniref:Aminoglycoside phosphotransferase domain-containing protein n=1 Tax=Hirsutella rhossiliensis TaxID=111463 RepID=A0A9P8SFT5_9HYPO|nr:uncharacterized protein HRG_08249 [Hirsutella rhossiliensis]KAH0961096.1 hypothetical protein HRG_08249 [Hirsutella rhossiliensis]